MELSSDIRYLKGVGEKRAELLNSLGVFNVGSLLHFYPRGYVDFSHIQKIRDCEFDKTVCVKAFITSPIKCSIIRKNMTIYKFTVSDSTAVMNVTMFNNKYLAEKLYQNEEYLFYGKLTVNKFGLGMNSPQIKPTSYRAIHPVYPIKAGLYSSNIEKAIESALKEVQPEEILPQNIKIKYNLCDLSFAINNVHFPHDKKSLDRARTRLAFDELLFLQLGMALKRSQNLKLGGIKIQNDYSNEFFSHLPFSPTSAQVRVTKECIADMNRDISMSRLVQGDVGSGKTAVAAALMYTVSKNGAQSVLMAPTEILAGQHYETLLKFFEGTDIKICLLCGSTTKKQKAIIKEHLKNGEYTIAVGTHALIEDDVIFKNLGLVITDEQHRFGVAQRTRLSNKGNNPHLLVMSATPIPRTMGLIIYGDLDISIIDEMPKGRQKIDTYSVSSSLKNRYLVFLKKHLDEGRQAYIVCPLIEDNDESNLTSAEEYYEELKSGFFNGYSVGLLHGKMKPKEKDAVMNKFKLGEIQLLVATTVIEVGIDVPNAVIMVIENAERFGLSQLHQLRGRIGRGQFKSSCILVSDFKGETEKRLNIMCSTADGFKIAEEDLKLRGPGDFLGHRQHGLPELKIADLSSDLDLLTAAGSAANTIITDDCTLTKPQNKPLRDGLLELFSTLRNIGYN